MRVEIVITVVGGIKKQTEFSVLLDHER